MTSAGTPVVVASTTTSTPASPETMDLQVNLGDLYIQKTQPDGGPNGNGDDPAWTLLRARLRIDPNGTNTSEFRHKVFSLRRYGDGQGPNTVNVPHKTSNELINWGKSDAEDMRLRVFNPEELYQTTTTTPYMQADVAVGGVVYWEVDNDAGGGDSGIEIRKAIVNNVTEFLGDTKAGFAKACGIQFNIQSYKKSPLLATASWYTSFFTGVKAAIDAFKSNLGETVTGHVKEKVNDYFNDGLSDWGKTDTITGVHLFVLIPVTTKFYDGLQSLRHKTKLAIDPFGDDLVTTMKMFPGDKFYTKSSTWLTFGFVPNGQPTSVPHSQKFPSGPGFFKKELGSDASQLFFRGGYDSMFKAGLGWTDRSELWTARDSGILAGPNIFPNGPGEDPSPTS